MENLVNYIYKKEYITEMSLSLCDFKKKITFLLNQIIENWCLVKWCDMYPNELTSKRLRNHWATELQAYMIKLCNFKLKSGRKDKVIKDELINGYELNDKNEVANFIRDKFEQEGLEKYVNIVSEECANNIENICNVLSGNSNVIKDYIYGCIG